MKVLQDSINRVDSSRYEVLVLDVIDLSESRENLRNFFEVIRLNSAISYYPRAILRTKVNIPKKPITYFSSKSI